MVTISYKSSVQWFDRCNVKLCEYVLFSPKSERDTNMDKMNAEEILRNAESDSDDSITVTIGEIKNDMVSLQLGRIGSSADLSEFPRSFDDTPFVCNAGASQFYFPPEIFINDSLPPFIEDISLYDTGTNDPASSFLDCAEADCGFSLAAEILETILDKVIFSTQRKTVVNQPQAEADAPSPPPLFSEGLDQQQQHGVSRSASGPELGEGESARRGQQSFWTVPVCAYALNPLQHSSAESIFGSCTSRESQLRDDERSS